MSKILPGTYIGKIVSHAITETKAGEPQSAVTFSIDAGSAQHQMLTWFGSFKAGKAAEITIKALVACGLKGNNPAGALEIGKEMSLVIEDDTDLKGVTRTKIRWVNSLGGAANLKQIAPDAARAKLSALEGAVMAARAGQVDESEIPF